MSEYCEKFLLEARRWIGRETSLRWGRYPVEREPIRRWCHMVKNANPLYLDESYALKTKWGGIICPPLMIPIFALHHVAPSASGPEIDWPPLPAEEAEEEQIRPPTPGRGAINLGGGSEFHKVVRLGDRIGSKQRLADVYIKPIRFDPEAFWIVTDTLFYNQHQDLVAVNHNSLVLHRSREQIAATTPEQLDQVRA